MNGKKGCGRCFTIPILGRNEFDATKRHRHFDRRDCFNVEVRNRWHACIGCNDDMTIRHHCFVLDRRDFLDQNFQFRLLLSREKLPLEKLPFVNEQFKRESPSYVRVALGSFSPFPSRHSHNPAVSRGLHLDCCCKRQRSSHSANKSLGVGD